MPRPLMPRPLTNEKLQLTARERQVAEQLATGATCREIAQRLDVSIKTVDTHRRHLLRKLGCRNAAELALHGVREGWVSPHE
jgi:DNA-binding CsgD family transcriptional regulator